MKKSALFPGTPFAVRFAAIFHRNPASKWNEKKEINNFRALSKHILEEDLILVERYYRSNWPPRTGKNHLRHDLATLINNWSSEVDRARIWGDAHPIKQPPRKIIPLPVQPSLPMTEEEVADANKFREQFKRHAGRELALPVPTSAFSKVRDIMKGEAE